MWACIPLILKTYWQSKLKCTITKELTTGLAGDCVSFKQAYNQTPLLSLYETTETRTAGVFGPKTVVGVCALLGFSYKWRFHLTCHRLSTKV